MIYKSFYRKTTADNNIKPTMDNIVYTEIAEETKASTATISRVNRCLNYGADGYNNILNRLDEK